VTTVVEVVGCTVPRLWTAPLRNLDEPGATLGHECIAFATIVLGLTLDPWQRWFLIHALELREDGSFRFRTIVLLVARQNGKTTVMRALTLWAIVTGRVRLVVGTAQDLDTAREAWESCRQAILDDPELAALAPRGYIITANGKEQIRLSNGARYKIKATNKDAGRGIPGVGLVLMDELRTHEDWESWAAISNTTLAIPNALIVGMSNAGTDRSIVLNSLRADALAGTDPDLGLFEYSAEDGCDLEDPVALAQANPSVGHGRMTMRALLSAVRKAPPAIARTENLCQHVRTVDSALDLDAWTACVDKANVADYRGAADGRSRLYGGLDVSLDGQHVTLQLAALDGARVRSWVAAAWDSVDAARADLPGILAALRLRRLGWCPSGPAAELSTVVRAAGRRKGSKYGTELVEFSGVALSEATMGLASAVRSRAVLHQGDDLTTAQVTGAGKLWQGDRFVYTRRGAGHVDAVYALAFATHVTLTEPRRRARTLEAPGGEVAAEAEQEDAPPPF
jgi:hypothetical protein